jgi:hypothetical protein
MKHARTVFAALYMGVHAALLLFATGSVFLSLTVSGYLLFYPTDTLI